MELEGVKNILVTNNYWVQIAKFLGRKSYDPSKIITVSAPEMVDTALVLGIDLKDSRTEARQWTYKVDIERPSPCGRPLRSRSSSSQRTQG
jgi:hypothetical protein